MYEYRVAYDTEFFIEAENAFEASKKIDKILSTIERIPEVVDMRFEQIINADTENDDSDKWWNLAEGVFESHGS